MGIRIWVGGHRVLPYSSGFSAFGTRGFFVKKWTRQLGSPTLGGFQEVEDRTIHEDVEDNSGNTATASLVLKKNW